MFIRDMCPWFVLIKTEDNRFVRQRYICLSLAAVI